MPDVDPREINKYKNLAGVKKALNKKYGENQWGDQEVVAYILEKRASRHKDAQAEVRQDQRRRKSHRERVDEYIKLYRDATPNDVTSFEQLVSIELQLDDVDSLRSRTTGIDDLKKINEMETKLSSEHRQLQVSLGINRSQREESLDAGNEIKRLVSGTNEFIRSKAIKIECPNCFSKHNITQGYIIFHFKDNVDWRWTSKCPNPECGHTLELSSPVQETVL